MLQGYDTSKILAHYGFYTQPSLYANVTNLPKSRFAWNRWLGIALITFSIGAFLSAYWPIVKLETGYQLEKAAASLKSLISGSSKDANMTVPQPSSFADLGLGFDPLQDPEGKSIVPVNNDFSLVVPKVGINAVVIPGVNPVSNAGYLEALRKGVAHSSTSFFPDENGTVYLFSHNTNYEWFIDDLNAVFYRLKNIESGDLVVVMYRGNRYTYKIRDKQVINAREISYLVPQPGVRTLILQTCWPPGSTWKRLLIFADLIDEEVHGSFNELMI